MRVCSLFPCAALACSLLCGIAAAQDNVLVTPWLSLDNAEIGIRPVLEKSSSGSTTANVLQYHDLFSGKLFLDHRHEFSLNFDAGAGGAFVAGWANTGAGSEPASRSFYLKQLYLEANPLSSLEVQWGGIGLERGVSTAMTSYNYDGFMSGERVYVRDPGHLFFDKMAVTFGYLGDVMHPDVWDRAHTLWMNNYQQYLIEKKISARAAASADYTVIAGARTFREAVRIDVPEFRIADRIQADVYERTNRTAAIGGNISAAKRISSRLDAITGYAAIDRNYGDLNDDAFFHGRRLYVAANVHLGRGFAVSPMFDHGVGNSYDLPNNVHFHVAFTSDLLAALKDSK